MKKSIWTLLLLAFSLAAVQASELGTVHGTVADVSGQQRVAHALLTLQSSAYTARTTTNEHGSFTLFGVPPDAYVATLQAPGYEPVMFRVCVIGGDAQNLPLLVGRASSEWSTYAHDQNVANRTLMQQTSDMYVVGHCGR